MNKFFELLKRNIEWVIIITLVLTIISPFIFTRVTFSNIGFSETGPIGDTIGGLTAPFLNFLGIILLYLTLREQTLSAKRQNEISTINSFYNATKSYVDSVQYYKTDTVIYTGYKAIYEFAYDLSRIRRPESTLDNKSAKAVLSSIQGGILNLFLLLKSNYESMADLEEKKIIYESAYIFYSPFDMIMGTAEGLGDALEGHELGPIVKIIVTQRGLLQSEYEKFNPDSITT